MSVSAALLLALELLPTGIAVCRRLFSRAIFVLWITFAIPLTGSMAAVLRTWSDIPVLTRILDQVTNGASDLLSNPWWIGGLWLTALALALLPRRIPRIGRDFS